MQKERMENLTTTRKIAGKRDRSQQRITFLKSLCYLLNITPVQLLESVKDRICGDRPYFDFSQVIFCAGLFYIVSLNKANLVLQQSELLSWIRHQFIRIRHQKILVSNYEIKVEFAEEYCTSDHFSARCGSMTEIVMIERAQYGRMSAGRCITAEYAQALGCFSEVTAYLDEFCSGRNNCSILVASIDSIAQPSSYVTDCHNKSETHLSSTIGYLVLAHNINNNNIHNNNINNKNDIISDDNNNPNDIPTTFSAGTFIEVSGKHTNDGITGKNYMLSAAISECPWVVEVDPAEMKNLINGIMQIMKASVMKKLSLAHGFSRADQKVVSLILNSYWLAVKIGTISKFWTFPSRQSCLDPPLHGIIFARERLNITWQTSLASSPAYSFNDDDSFSADDSSEDDDDNDENDADDDIEDDVDGKELNARHALSNTTKNVEIHSDSFSQPPQATANAPQDLFNYSQQSTACPIVIMFIEMDKVELKHTVCKHSRNLKRSLKPLVLRYEVVVLDNFDGGPKIGKCLINFYGVGGKIFTGDQDLW
ncbi:hypothetical protein HELRODRAFT_168055 [Helobdella robusta]|uniref:SUEL-type lectin domain-containing protein n=1 Tax=Helobdella robusta TaxID=6412 RepID=T1F043_HELRO|nr:hypothetical protein HELRODRAFT_168055 [Helobdella robusta]ESO10183.1 hypothetical protein HELRODRAFT_168055 [Helobdella robusta]